MISYVLFAHFISDFVLQSRWVAENKAKNGQALMLHGFIYAVGLFAMLLVFPYWFGSGYYDLLFYVAINWFLHVHVDLITSQLTSYYYENKKVFWVCIGADQLIHGLCLINTSGLI